MFTKRDKRLFRIMIGIQILLSLIDLFAVLLVGIVGSLAISGVSSGQPSIQVGNILKILGIFELNIQQQSTILGSLAAFLLISKTLISIYFTRKSLRFLSFRAAHISTLLLRKVLNQDLLDVNSGSFQTKLYSVTRGVETLSVGVVGTALIMTSDLILTLIMIVGLFAIEPLMAGATLFFFGSVGFILQKALAGRTQQISMLQTQYGIRNNQQILEVLGAYREIFVRNRRNFYADKIGIGRQKLAQISAEKAFLPNISKFVFEITTVLGAILLAAYQFYSFDAVKAIGVLTVFLGASARISPALLRVQQGFLTVRGSAASAITTLDLIKQEITEDQLSDGVNSVYASSFIGSVDLREVSFRYTTNEKFALNRINLSVKSGEMIALVGPSGSGKSTLVDLILGLLGPSSGEILVSGLPPRTCIKTFPGEIGYVPQETNIFDGTIRENVTLGFEDNDFTDEQVMKSLAAAALTSFIEDSNLGLNTPVGERGTRLSGGQRQRVGIARAMITQPNLLILDEATSALDGHTESQISDAIASLKRRCTVILIAHRLSTVKNADRIVYLENGIIKCVGSFSDLRRQIPDFDMQAKLMEI
jgi:ABC-type multidrug transport system fused ATPase/permease subunit